MRQLVDAEWRDPDDDQAMHRGPDGRRHQRLIQGKRAADVCERLSTTLEHRQAITRLRDAWERGSGARTGAAERVDGGTGNRDGIAAIYEARRTYQEAVVAVGPRLCAYLLPVVLDNWSVADLVRRHGGNDREMMGRVLSGLDRLVDWWWPGEVGEYNPLDATRTAMP